MWFNADHLPRTICDRFGNIWVRSWSFDKNSFFYQCVERPGEVFFDFRALERTLGPCRRVHAEAVLPN